MMPADIVAIARTWLGTPYHHQASVKGVGCDCLGLVRGVYAEACGHPAEEPPAYTRDLAEACQSETLLEAARRHLIEINADDYAPGDVVIFRLRPGAMAKHCGIISTRDPDRMIHAFESGPVCEVNLSSWWRRKIAAAFRFPL
jgi:NlpC/P60 family putative phage cell wall peptidase